MTIKIKLRPDHKAIIRFKDDSEMNFFRFVMTRMRDDPSKNHPPVSIKTPDNKEVPKLPEMKPQVVSGQPFQQPIAIQAQPAEQPVIVSKAQIDQPTIYYSKEQLIAENKQQCLLCKHATTEGKCNKGPQENYYWDEKGNILGCTNGEAIPASQ